MISSSHVSAQIMTLKNRSDKKLMRNQLSFVTSVYPSRQIIPLISTLVICLNTSKDACSFTWERDAKWKARFQQTRSNEDGEFWWINSVGCCIIRLNPVRFKRCVFDWKSWLVQLDVFYSSQSLKSNSSF